MLKGILTPFTDRAYALMRIVIGLMMFVHGLQGLVGWPTPKHELDMQGLIGKIIELSTGLLVAAGFFSRSAAFLASGTMAVAYWQFHVIKNVTQQTGYRQFLPMTNGGELAAVYCFLFLFIACKGPGPWSVDASREKAADSK
jgi:putative oxidoreductase